jgi:hypothetical protein
MWFFGFVGISDAMERPALPCNEMKRQRGEDTQKDTLVYGLKAC